jgi:hypothetical protein
LAPPLAVRTGPTRRNRSNTSDLDPNDEDPDQDQNRYQCILVTQYCPPPWTTIDTTSSPSIVTPSGTTQDTTTATTTATTTTSTTTTTTTRATGLQLFPTSHDEWLQSSIAQTNVILEIAVADPAAVAAAGGDGGGGDTSTLSSSTTQGKIHLVVPGSLKHDGSYCIVEMSYDEECDDHQDNDKERDNDKDVNDVVHDYRWKVRTTTFHRLDYG